jgi:hypothetical protein
VAVRKSFLLRVDAAVLEAMQRWANDDLRSLNGEIEYVLREALRKAGRLPRPAPDDGQGAVSSTLSSSSPPSSAESGDQQMDERPSEED